MASRPLPARHLLQVGLPTAALAGSSFRSTKWRWMQPMQGHTSLGTLQLPGQL